ncbi:hypothetical protein H7X87_01485 [Acetobacteraceae bacterium]|nr:hypothetical protein [Candidatus Parcubacteria bacterium]
MPTNSTGNETESRRRYEAARDAVQKLCEQPAATPPKGRQQKEAPESDELSLMSNKPLPGVSRR